MALQSFRMGIFVLEMIRKIERRREERKCKSQRRKAGKNKGSDDEDDTGSCTNNVNGEKGVDTRKESR